MLFDLFLIATTRQIAARVRRLYDLRLLKEWIRRRHITQTRTNPLPLIRHSLNAGDKTQHFNTLHDQSRITLLQV